MAQAGSAERLYTADVLGLAVELARYPLTGEFFVVGEARSPSCGSTLQIGLDLTSQSGVERIGLQVSACAIGQASAALFARDAKGHTRVSLENGMQRVANWLARESEEEPWAGLDRVRAAREYPARHGAILLPWRAALDALSKA
ncbi:iron-sulfur cluster assembly scaffold protein [Erythrobacter litoralis]|uniref:Fe-S cluster formation protein n=1 Tax=Erythrobacter litoralis (strain HTCC2594) TaxID=314225 RepID=Q2NAI2_ERYLH|nr:iron-sulfur cluster assembly scaffold protein [Erythrobacter litoralis]ABC63309.1 Fe-S cluster formation protein [Erythrobacter litoralis HTCC2594]